MSLCHTRVGILVVDT